MHIVVTIMIGFLAGFVAKTLTRDKDPIGFIITTLLGITGAFLAKYAGVALNLFQPQDGVGFIAAFLGAVVVLAIYHLFAHRNRLVHH